MQKRSGDCVIINHFIKNINEFSIVGEFDIDGVYTDRVNGIAGVGRDDELLGGESLHVDLP